MIEYDDSASSNEIMDEAQESWVLGLRVMPYNARMRQARLKMNLTQRDLGLLVGVSQRTISEIETLACMPNAELAQEIADALSEDVASLFPQWAAGLHKRFTRDVALLVTAADVLPNAVAAQELATTLRNALNTLSPRERTVLSMRFGLDDGCARTLEEVGAEFGITRQYIRQIEDKALRKLGHPSRAKELKDFLD